MCTARGMQNGMKTLAFSIAMIEEMKHNVNFLMTATTLCIITVNSSCDENEGTLLISC